MHGHVSGHGNVPRPGDPLCALMSTSDGRWWPSHWLFPLPQRLSSQRPARPSFSLRPGCSLKVLSWWGLPDILIYSPIPFPQSFRWEHWEHFLGPICSHSLVCEATSVNWILGKILISVNVPEIVWGAAKSQWPSLSQVWILFPCMFCPIRREYVDPDRFFSFPLPFHSFPLENILREYSLSSKTFLPYTSFWILLKEVLNKVGVYHLYCLH